MSAEFAGHLLHYAVTVVGLAGVATLLLPQVALRDQPRAPRSTQDQRIADLRYTAELGLLGTGATLTRPRVRRAQLRCSTTLLPMTVIGSAGAAGVHAAVGPGHLGEGFLVGSFFVLSSLFQLGWAALVLNQPSRRLLELGVGVNVAFIGLWVVTRTVGLPFGLVPGAEGVGAWDLAAVTFEGAVVAACLAQLHRGQAFVGPWARWSTAARGWLAVSLLVLGTLTVTGTG